MFYFKISTKFRCIFKTSISSRSFCVLNPAVNSSPTFQRRRDEETIPWERIRKIFIKKMTLNLLRDSKNVYVSVLKNGSGPKKGEIFLKLTFFYDFSASDVKEISFNRQPDSNLAATFERISIKLNDLSGKNSGKKRMKKIQPSVDDVETAKDAFSNKLLFIKNKNGETIDSQSSNLEAFSNGFTFHIGTKTYEILYKVPHMDKFKIDHRLMAGFPVVPSVNITDGSVEDSLYFWHVEENCQNSAQPLQRSLSVDNNLTQEEQLKHIAGFTLKSSQFFYIPTAEDVGKRLCLTCLPKGQRSTGLPNVYVANTTIEDVIGDEEMIWSERHRLCAERTSRDTLRVVDYNILANLYLDLDNKPQDQLYFPYCPVEYQEHSYRYPLLLKELLGYNADILCLQEVEQKFWIRFSRPFLERNGFVGLFACKGQKVNEGSATFYRPDKLKFVESADIIISELLNEDKSKTYEDLIDVCKQSKEVFDFFTTRPAVLQVSLFSSVFDENAFAVVCSTHFHFAPKHGHIRILQAAFCQRYIWNYVENVKKNKNGSKVGVIFCGDFNTVPTEAVYGMLTTGRMSVNDKEWCSGSTDNSEFKGIGINVPLELKSACCPLKYTNFTGPHFQGCLDYVFITEDVFKVDKVYPMPRHELVEKYIGLPSKICPSDHLPLICDLKFA